MRFIVFEEVDGSWHWQLITEDDSVVAVSSVGLPCRDSALAAVDAVREHVISAPVYDSAGVLYRGI